MNHVHFKGGGAMNPAVTSKDEILSACRAIVSAEGLSALNMRRVADDCGVALGSLYHYFASKDEMMTAAVESVWQEIFHMDAAEPPALPFPAYVEWLFSCVREGAGAYPNFSLAHSVSFASTARAGARQTMTRCFSRMKEGLAQSLRRDPNVRPDAFSARFTQEALVDFVFSSFLLSLAQKQEHCDVLLELVRRAIYPA